MNKWILIWVHNNFIQEPFSYDTYADAYEDMLDEYTRFSSALNPIKAEISEIYAYIKTAEYDISWRIYHESVCIDRNKGSN